MITSDTRTIRPARDQGVALLFSILLTATLLLVAIGISQVSYKEGEFALEARDSDRAFTAADTGIECALYLDNNAFFTTTSDTYTMCHNLPVILNSVGTETDPSYEFSLALSPTSCAQVYVDKNYNGTSTRVEAYGYNVKQQQAAEPAQCVTNATNPSIVTRALRTTYPNPASP